MAHTFDLPGRRYVHWKLKIFGGELPFEEPHVTLYKRATKYCRISLLTGRALDPRSCEDVPKGLFDHVRENLGSYAPIWDEMYPKNRILPEPEPSDFQK